MKKLLYLSLIALLALIPLKTKCAVALPAGKKICTLENVDQERLKYYKNITKKAWGLIAKRVIVLLEQEKKALFNELGITKQDLEKARRKLQFHYSHPAQGRSQSARDKSYINNIESYIRSELGVDTALLHIAIDPNKKNDTQDFGNLISLTSHVGAELEEESIAHETIHFLQGDNALLELSLNERPRAKLTKYVEKRADCLAIMASELTAGQLVRRLKPDPDSNYYRASDPLWQQADPSGGNAHPSHAERYQYLSEIYRQMIYLEAFTRCLCIERISQFILKHHQTQTQSNAYLSNVSMPIFALFRALHPYKQKRGPYALIHNNSLQQHKGLSSVYMPTFALIPKALYPYRSSRGVKQQSHMLPWYKALHHWIESYDCATMHMAPGDVDPVLTPLINLVNPTISERSTEE